MQWIWLPLGYLVGSIPTGYWLVRLLRGVDIRTLGSGNIGATNVGRVLGRGWAVVVAFFDMAKGGIFVFLEWSLGIRDPWLLSLTGAAAVVGHDFPLWLSFKGGKGVATTFGVLFFFDFFNPWPALLSGGLWYGVMRFSGYVSLASLISLGAAPFFFLFFRAPTPYVATSAGLWLLTLWKHRANISRLLEGTENRVRRGSHP